MLQKTNVPVIQKAVMAINKINAYEKAGNCLYE